MVVAVWCEVVESGVEGYVMRGGVVEMKCVWNGKCGGVGRWGGTVDE